MILGALPRAHLLPLLSLNKALAAATAAPAFIGDHYQRFESQEARVLALADGIRTGNRRRVRALLLHGGLGGGGTGNFDLRFAAAAVDGDVFAELLAAGGVARLHAVPRGGLALPNAAAAGRVANVRLLLDAGAATLDGSLAAAVGQAAMSRRAEALTVLVAAGGDADDARAACATRGWAEGEAAVAAGLAQRPA